MTLTLKRVTDRTLRWSRFSVRGEDGREVAMIGEFHDWIEAFCWGPAYWIVLYGENRDWETKHASPQDALQAVQERMATT